MPIATLLYEVMPSKRVKNALVTNQKNSGSIAKEELKNTQPVDFKQIDSEKLKQ